MKELEKLSFVELKKTAKEKGIKIPRTTTKEMLLNILKEEQEKEFWQSPKAKVFKKLFIAELREYAKANGIQLENNAESVEKIELVRELVKKTDFLYEKIKTKKENKYKLTSEMKIVNNKIVYRIKSLKKFETIQGEYIEKGDLGGFVQYPTNLSHDGRCWIEDNAVAMENATVTDDAIVGHDAIVSENAIIQEFCEITDDAKVKGKAIIGGYAEIGAKAIIGGTAKISGTDIIVDRLIETTPIDYGVGFGARIIIYGDQVAIGHECHDALSWLSFSDEEIMRMGDEEFAKAVLDFKPILMKKFKIKKQKITQKELLEIIMDNFYNQDTNTIELNKFDWGNVNVDFSGQKMKGDLKQNHQEIDGYVIQNNQRIKKNLVQDYQDVGGDLSQYYQNVVKDIYQSGQNARELHQRLQKIKINLFQDYQEIGGAVVSKHQKVKEDVFSFSKNIEGDVFYSRTLKGGKYYGLKTEYDILFSNKKITIGCQTHTREEWSNFSNKEILKFGGIDALRFWKKLKPILVEMRELPSPAPKPINKVDNFDILTGTAMPGATITVTLPNGSTVSTTTNKNGNWTIKSSPVKVVKNDK